MIVKTTVISLENESSMSTNTEGLGKPEKVKHLFHKATFNKEENY